MATWGKDVCADVSLEVPNNKCKSKKTGVRWTVCQILQFKPHQELALMPINQAGGFLRNRHCEYAPFIVMVRELLLTSSKLRVRKACFSSTTHSCCWQIRRQKRQSKNNWILALATSSIIFLACSCKIQDVATTSWSMQSCTTLRFASMLR